MNLFYELISDNAGRKIRRERKSWGMSRRRLAKLSGTDKETIEYIENGYVCMLDANLLRRISEALDVSMFDFFKKQLTFEEMLQII